MAVYRNPPNCPKCGIEYNGIYRDNDGTFIGDDFIKWDIEGHVCSLAKSVEVENEFTVNTARDILKEIGITTVGNGNFIRKNMSTELVVFAMVKYANVANSWQQQKQADAISRLRKALEEISECRYNDPIGKPIRLAIEALKEKES